MFTYNAEVVKIVDGDTVDLNIDLGFHIIMTRRVRLLGINAPERFTAEGEDARTFITSQIPPGTKVIVKTKLDSSDKYGRVLGEIFLSDISINNLMIEKGHAVAYMT